MLSRVRRFAARSRVSPARVDEIEQRLAAVSQHLAAIDGRHSTVAAGLEDVPGFFLLLEASVSDRWNDKMDQMRAELAIVIADAVVTTRTHTEEAVAAAETSAIASARLHTEAAVAAAETSAIASARLHTEAAVAAAVSTSVSYLEEFADQLRQQVDRELAALRREVQTIRRVGPESVPSPPMGAQAEHQPRGSISPAFYVALEDRFRGEQSLITERQRRYVPLVGATVDDAHPLVDLGCGRGEWLNLLRDSGIPAFGVDTNEAFAAEVAEAGHHIVVRDLLEFLRSVEERSLGAVTMFQVVEHLPLPVLLDALSHCARALVPGGVLIAETPNALNLSVASSTFWIDPTHQKPLHPEFLKFCAQQVGFAHVDGWFVNELAEPDDTIIDPNVRRLVQMVDGPGDFTMIARV